MSLQRIFSAAVLITVLSGCSLTTRLAPQPTPTATQAPTPTSTPTVTPLPTPTATPTPLPSAHLANGDHALWNGDYDLALEEYQAAKTSGSEPAIVTNGTFGMGRVQYLQGKYPEALDTFRELLKSQPGEDVEAWATFWLAKTYAAVQRSADAAESYARYLKLRPGVIDAEVQELRGDALNAAGEATQAIEAYQAAIQAPRLGEAVSLDIKIGQVFASTGNYASAIEFYNTAYTTTTSDYTKADADLYSGQAYVALNDLENAGERFRDAVINFPRTYSAYASLVNLVDLGLPVNDYYRGVVDYYAEQYPAALAALDRYLNTVSEQNGSALHFKALTQVGLEDYAGAVITWTEFLRDYPSNDYWATAWNELAYTQWAQLDQFAPAAENLLSFVSQAPQNTQAPAALYEAGRIYERGDLLEQAALIWERLGSEYPSADQTFRGLLFAGVARFRMQQWDKAESDFQRALLLASAASDQAAAGLWIGKVLQKQGKNAESQTAWQQASQRDPTGYYSERSRELISGRLPFSAATSLDLGVDLRREKGEAETWLRTTFQLPAETDLSGLGQLATDTRLLRGRELWNLGLYSQAQDEFEALRISLVKDPAGTYRLINYLDDLGMYRSVIYGARQILDSAGLSDSGTISAPVYFNHLRFGTFYRDLIVPAAQDEGLDPLFAFALVRQESLFEGFAHSSADARGLMQIVPATAQGVAANLNWPSNFTTDDLYRPVVSIRLGMRYLSQQLKYFDGDMFAALAAYNGGPGNTLAWKELSSGDPDLFLETVRIEETRTYIMRIYEIYTIYRLLYDRSVP